MNATDRSYFSQRRSLPLGERSHLVGILNLTPDSFSDGGEFSRRDRAVARFHEMVAEGASIIDIGGESTRPGYTPVSIEEEIGRVVPFIKRIRGESDTLLSIDTSKAAVAEAAIDAGADIVNDVWGAQLDPEMATVIGRSGASCILMHNRPADQAGKGDVMTAIRCYLEKSVEKVLAAGVRKDAIALDPGLGFGKTYEENWKIMRRLDALREMGFPILLGASRKSMIAKLLKKDSPKDRLNGTLATTALAVRAGIELIRVHDVRENREVADVVEHCRQL